MTNNISFCMCKVVQNLKDQKLVKRGTEILGHDEHIPMILSPWYCRVSTVFLQGNHNLLASVIGKGMTIIPGKIEWDF